MQRRAGAAFVVFFLLVGAASLGLVVTAESPELEASGQTYQQGDTFTVSGTEYTVSKVEKSESGGGGGHGGGHGGGGGSVSYEAVFEWTNDSFQYTESWGNNSTVSYDGKQWRVLVGDGDDPTTFTLEEDIDESAILADDPNAADEMVTHEGEQHVVVTENGTEKLVPASEYFPAPETREFAEGETFDYDGNETTVESVSTSGASLTWTAPKVESVSAGQKGNVTLGDQTYFLYFESGDEVLLSSDFAGLNQYEQASTEHHHHKNGLWGVTILSGTTAILLLGMAYMPSRY